MIGYTVNFSMASVVQKNRNWFMYFFEINSKAHWKGYNQKRPVLTSNCIPPFLEDEHQTLRNINCI